MFIKSYGLFGCNYYVCMYVNARVYVCSYVFKQCRKVNGFSDNEFLGCMKGRLPGSSQEDDCYRR